MQLSELSAKQKRAHSWEIFLKSEVRSEDLRLRFVQSLNAYRALLAKCWEQGAISATDLHAIQTAERELEDLDEEARLTVTAKN